MAKELYKKRSIDVTITGPPEQVDEMEKLLWWIDYLCSVGHSAGAIVGVDGDGAGMISIEKKKGKLKGPEEDDPDYRPNVSAATELKIGIGESIESAVSRLVEQEDFGDIVWEDEPPLGELIEPLDPGEFPRGSFTFEVLIPSGVLVCVGKVDPSYTRLDPRGDMGWWVYGFRGEDGVLRKVVGDAADVDDSYESQIRSAFWKTWEEKGRPLLRI